MVKISKPAPSGEPRGAGLFCDYLLDVIRTHLNSISIRGNLKAHHVKGTRDIIMA